MTTQNTYNIKTIWIHTVLDKRKYIVLRLVTVLKSHKILKSTLRLEMSYSHKKYIFTKNHILYKDARMENQLAY